MDEYRDGLEEESEPEEEQRTMLFVGVMIAVIAGALLLYAVSGIIGAETAETPNGVDTGPDEPEDDAGDTEADAGETEDAADDAAVEPVGPLSEDSEERMEWECIERAEHIANDHCTQLTRDGDCTDLSFEQDPEAGYETTASEEGCSWGDPEIVEDANPLLTEHILTQEDDQYELIVEVDDESYNCVDEGVIADRSCPVQFQ